MATVKICDACRRDLGNEDVRRIKSKQRSHLWHETLVERGRLTMHEDCWQSILKIRRDMVDKAMQENAHV